MIYSDNQTNVMTIISPNLKLTSVLLTDSSNSYLHT